MTPNCRVRHWMFRVGVGSLNILARRCCGCGTQAFPRTTACKKCSSTNLEQALLGPDAVLYSVTTDRTSTSAENHKLVGQVQFTDGAYVQGYGAGDINHPPTIGAHVD